MEVIYKNIEDVEPDVFTKQGWLDFLTEEIKNIRKRFGEDTEAIEFWPNDYYEKMEQWWLLTPTQEPIKVYRDDEGIIRISDGWHRLAISHKNNLSQVPVIFVKP